MIKILKDPNSEVRANAAWGLGFVYEHVSPEELLNFLKKKRI
jgi:HEAT repeat protein